jgi:dihydroneopterin aldolase
MDRIELKNMQFYGYHGVFEEEKKLGQRYQIDVVLETCLREAGRTDDLHHSIDYSKVYEDVSRIVTGSSFDLIETVGEEIATELLKNYIQVRKVSVTVRKPEVPIPGILDFVAIHIERERDER